MTLTQRLARLLWRTFERHGWPSRALKWAPKILGAYLGVKGRKVK